MEDNQVKAFLERIREGECNAVSVVNELLPDGTKQAKVEFRRTVEPPLRMESPRRAHTFYEAAGFAEYVKKEAFHIEDAMVLIDAQALTAKAVLDDTAANGFEVITFKPPFHPLFVLLRNSLLKTQSVRDFADAVVRCRRQIVGMDGKEIAGQQLAMLMRQITVSNQVTCESGAGNNALNGVMVKTNVRAGQQTESKIDLPEALTLATPVFMSGPTVRLEVLVSIQPVTAEKVLIAAEVPDLDVIVYDEFGRMLEPLKGDCGCRISYGRIDHQSWTYVGNFGD